ncbi:Adhesion and penetration protein autotransporter precursor [Haemophilus influenzae]|uniref:S6 family peptidase n=1 Tax=Haemophilus influenzae TaxID=727 RepID=UPI000D4AA117|nr:S6 family peptidase [Haemophilus influenzae]PRI44285.1 Adhesion and penetration protein autotransporter precursor [Haemophilus influenzae]PRK14304.1 Adhesion and penetration protein autotransporter precursor [Haemophilus influenzae]PRM43828.1 Adhesion and penetration protein autotransporter precursor [Haemophilus influenzae]
MKKTVFRLNFLTACVSLGIVSQAWAGHTYFGIDYQYYRDFAENKGKFTVGAKNIEVYNKKGELVGTSMTKAPMIDFSVVSRNGVAALVENQYIVSVAHNGGYTDVDFGAEGRNPDQHRFTYQIVKRNNYKPGPYDGDYHMPRLHKFVTESEPIGMTQLMDGNKYADLNKYPDRVRIGSGKQWQRTDEQQANGSDSSFLKDAYHWLIAGNTHIQTGTGNGTVDLNGNLTKTNHYGPLPTAGSFGDSGSPMFIYNAEQKKWFINGVLRLGNPFLGGGNLFQLVRKDWFYTSVFPNDTKAYFFDPMQRPNKHYLFTANDNGTGTVTKTEDFTPTTVRLFNPNLKERGVEQVYTNGGNNFYKPQLDNAESLTFMDTGKGKLIFTNSINQGAGGLYFEGDFDVSTANPNDTWQGAGISISDESTVIWKVNGVEHDRLSKIGKGTLHIQAKGKNLGSINVGDGKVILEQQEDDQHKKQAFSEIGLVSGRGTVQLNDDKQFDTDKFYFGFRGGRLDLNGHSLTFKRIQNTDEGAMIVNHNTTQVANVTITGYDTINDDLKQLTNKRDIAFNGWFGETDENKYNGRLNLIYQPTAEDRTLLLSGGTNLKGDITQTKGKLFFSGRPTPHAYNHLNEHWSKMENIPQGEIVWDHDWINRTFKAENFQIKGGSAVVSRNVSKIEGNWTISNNANATFGVVPNQQNTICTRSDWTGLTTCKTVDLNNNAVIASIPITQINGSINLTNNATANINGLAKLNGDVTLTNHSQFTLSNNATQTGNIQLSNLANATVNNATLTGNVNLTDSSRFTLSNQATQIGTISLHQQTQATVDNATLTGNVNLMNTSRFTLSNQATQTGNIKLSDNANATVDNATLMGNVNLKNSAQFSLKNSHFSHQIQGDEGTTVMLENATWTMPSDTTLQNLTLNNSTVTLNSAYSATTNNTPLRRRRSLETETTPTSAEHRFNTLTVNGTLRGKGTFQFTSSLFGYESDKLKLSNDAEGIYKLAVHDTGKEPVTLEQLTLIESKDNQPLSNKLTFTLENDHVDAGALRYELVKNNGEFRLHNPIKEKELRNDLVKVEQTERTLEAKQAELNDKKQKTEAKVRSKRAAFSDTPPDQSQLNALQAELEAINAKQQAVQAVQNQKATALNEKNEQVKTAQEKAQTAKADYQTTPNLQTAKALDKANLALATALVEKETAQIDFVSAKLVQLNLTKQQQEKALAVAEEAKKLADKTLALNTEKQALDAANLSLEVLNEELLKTQAELAQAQANNADLKAKKALLERDKQAQENQKQAAANFRTRAATTEAEKATATENKERAATQNNESSAALDQANQNVEKQKQAVETLKSSTETLASDVTRTEEEKTQAQTSKSAAETRQTTEQTMPVTTAFRKAQEQEEKQRQAQEQATEKERKVQEEAAEKQRKAQEEAAEKERLAQEQAERERQAQEQAERERKVQEEAAEKQRQAQEKAEKERQAQEKEEKERLAQEQAEQERKVQEEAAEKERQAQEKAEKERQAQEKEEKERLAQEQAEQERKIQEQAEKQRKAQEQAEKERQAQEEQAERERQTQEEAAEKQRQAQEQAEKQRKAQEEQAEREHQAQEKAEKERQTQEEAAEKQRKKQEQVERQRKQKDLISRYSNSALSELSATVNSMLSVQDELDRLFVDQAQSAVWTNIAQDKRRYDSDAFRAYQQKTNLRQIGVQKALANGRIGAVFSHSRSDNTFDEQVKNHATLTMMSGFAQYQWGDLQLGVNVGTGISASKMAEEQSRKIHRKAINYGVNASYSFHLGQLGIQPYLGVNRYFIERENYQSEEVKVQTPSLAFNRYNAGVRVDYTFTPTDNISVKPYFFVNYVDVSNANVQTTVNRTVLQQPFGRYWQKEVGLKAEILHFQLSAFISKSQGSQLGKQRNMGVKFGYRW